MRGKAPPHAVKRRLSGITPAYAGKSAFLVGVVGDFGDHPRVCGEKASFTNVLACGEGSPPRMRGKAWLQLYAIASARITPAYAGKSRIRAGRGAASGDHPRVCGEKTQSRPAFDNISGSPPRMRGKESRSPTMAQPSGITPAYAGKRLKRSHRIGHFSCILCLFHSVLHRASASGGSRAGPCAPPCLPAQNAVPV